MSRLVYAIDFGTSNSLLAAATADKVHPPIPLDPGASDPTILRTLLYFPSMKKVHFGSDAIQEFIAHDLEGRFLRSIKRFLPMRSFIGTFIEDRPMNLEDIVALFLSEMRKRANAHFGADCDAVVLGRPAKFSETSEDDDFAQYRLERAAKIAGFKHIEFLPEPVAAAREYQAKVSHEGVVIVGDFGGGTSDYTVMRVHRGKFNPSDVLAIGGVPVAGDALDGAIMRSKIAPHFGSKVEYKVPFGSNVMTMPKALMEKICTPAEISVLRKRDTIEFFNNVKKWSLGPDDRHSMDQLFALIHEQLGFDVFERIERAKRDLSGSHQASFEFKHPSVEIREKISRQEFEGAAEDQLTRITDSLDETLSRAGLKPSDVTHVFLTGGTARVPYIQSAFVERFGKEKLEERKNFHAVVEGLAERARDFARDLG